MFGKNDDKPKERVIYQARSNMILGCKKAILGFILLILVMTVSGPIIQFIGRMQVYLISQINLPLTRYTAIAVFVLMLVLIIYIIWQIIGWYATEYLLTDTKVVVQSGIFITNKNNMPYSSIQDINTSQSLLARLFNVGSVSVFSAYDNNQITINNISNPSQVEEIIFSNMNRNRGYYPPPQQDYGRSIAQQNYYDDSQRDYYQSPQNNYPESQRRLDDYYEDDYDDVVITPIHEEQQYQRRQYDYYPEDLNYNNVQRPKYEYEPYDESLEHNINKAMESNYNSYDDSPIQYQNNSYSNDVDRDYYVENENYESNKNEYPKDDIAKESHSQSNVESSETVIKRHFDKFKK